MKQTILIFCLSIFTFSAFAQFHYKGLQTVTSEYGVHSYSLSADYNQHYSLSYHQFIGRNLNIQLSGQYERLAHTNSFSINHYDVNAAYVLNHYWLNAGLNFTILQMGKRVFFDLGVGPTTGMRFVKRVTQYQAVFNEARAEEYQNKNMDKELPNDPNYRQGALNDKWLIGLQAPVTLEVYLSRHFSLLARHRVNYLIKHSTDRWTFHTTVGASIHF